MPHPLPTALHFLGTLLISTLIVAAVIGLAIALLRLLSDRVQVIDVCDGCGRRMDQHKMASRPGGPCSGMCVRCFEAANPVAVVVASLTVEAVATPDYEHVVPPVIGAAHVVYRQVGRLPAREIPDDDRAVLIQRETASRSIPLIREGSYPEYAVDVLPGFEDAEETETYANPPKGAA